MRKSNLFLIIAIWFYLIGCASGPNPLHQMLDSRMNSMTYGEAIQRFGPPTQCANAETIMVCDWVEQGRGSVTMPIGGMMANVPMRSSCMRLTFTNGVMTYWQIL